MFSIKNSNVNLFRKAFESAYSNATRLLAEITGEQIYYNNFHHGLHGIGIEKPHEFDFLDGKDSYTLITNKVSGASGLMKIYFILSISELNTMTALVSKTKVLTDREQEEFIVELNNILSATVLEILTNKLKLELSYSTSVLQQFDGDLGGEICREFWKTTDLIYINASFFSFDRYPYLRPYFICVLDGNYYLKSGINR